MPKQIKLRILLQNPVDGVLYGLQKGKGADYETVQAQIGTGKDLTFEFAIEAKEAKGPGISLTGPFVQGPAGGRFVYVGIGSYAGQAAAPWSGRLKVPLPEASFQNLPAEKNDPDWHCTVPGRTESGKPFFATVKPFGGWIEGKR